MGKEIERKFLVNHAQWEKLNKPAGKHFRQGYLSIDPAKTVRVRLAEQQAWLTIKGMTIGATRQEYEYAIPAEEAKELLDQLATHELEKVRYVIEYQQKHWEVDVFMGANVGLIVAEIELSAEDETFEKPHWIDAEVTEDKRYYNASLSQHPFQDWE